MTNEEYLNANASLYDDGEADVRCRTVRVVKTRKEQRCMCPSRRGCHQIPAGSRAVVDRALVDGKWGACYTCLPCLESWWKSTQSDCEDWCSVCPSLESKP